MVLVLTTGAIFVMWLGEQITERGIGNGMSLLITFSILDRLWPSFIQLLQYINTRVVSILGVVVYLALILLVVGLTVAMTMAARRIPIQVPRKVMGRGRIQEGKKSFIPVRMLAASVMPIIFAQTIIIVPGTLASFFPDMGTLRMISTFFTPGAWPYMLTFTVLTVLFSYFYVSIVFPTVDIAENLKKQGAFVPGVKPGAATASHVDGVVARVTLPGALFLAMISLIPFLVSGALGFQSAFGGTSVLIVVGVLLDTIAQVDQHRTLRKYDSLMMKGRVRFRGRQQRYI